MPADEKPVSQFKLARMQAQAEREASQARARGATAAQEPFAAAPHEPKAPLAGPAGPIPQVAVAAAAGNEGAAGAPGITKHQGHQGATVGGGGVDDGSSSRDQGSPAGAQQPRRSETTPASGSRGGPASQRSAPARAANVEETVDEKVERYSKFVDETLRVRLAQVLDQREEVVRDIEAFEKLRGTIQVMRESKSSKAKSMVNVGCDLYMQAAIPDTSRIMVNVGLGFFVEFTLAGCGRERPLAGAGLCAARRRYAFQPLPAFLHLHVFLSASSKALQRGGAGRAAARATRVV